MRIKTSIVHILNQKRSSSKNGHNLEGVQIFHNVFLLKIVPLWTYTTLSARPTEYSTLQLRAAPSGKPNYLLVAPLYSLLMRKKDSRPTASNGSVADLPLAVPDPPRTNMPGNLTLAS